MPLPAQASDAIPDEPFEIVFVEELNQTARRAPARRKRKPTAPVRAKPKPPHKKISRRRSK
jgi:hypothetical protein